jgi:hypothetical protein
MVNKIPSLIFLVFLNKMCTQVPTSTLHSVQPKLTKKKSDYTNMHIAILLLAVFNPLVLAAQLE